MILGHTGEGHGPGDPTGDVNQFCSRHGEGCLLPLLRRPRALPAQRDELQVYMALSTRNRGEVISDDY